MLRRPWKPLPGIFRKGCKKVWEGVGFTDPLSYLYVLITTNTTVMELKLKEGVFGFVWNFEDGEVVDTYTEELSSREIELIGRVVGSDICIIIDNSDISLVFGDDIENQDELEEMGLAGVMEFV